MIFELWVTIINLIIINITKKKKKKNTIILKTHKTPLEKYHLKKLILSLFIFYYFATQTHLKNSIDSTCKVIHKKKKRRITISEIYVLK